MEYRDRQCSVLQRIYVSQKNGIIQTSLSPDNSRDNIIPPEYEAFAARYAPSPSLCAFCASASNAKKNSKHQPKEKT